MELKKVKVTSSSGKSSYIFSANKNELFRRLRYGFCLGELGRHDAEGLERKQTFFFVF